MRTLKPPRVAASFVAACALLVSSMTAAAHANTPSSAPPRAAVRAPQRAPLLRRALPAPARQAVRPAPRAPAVRAAPQRPRVALQLTAVQTHVPVSRSAVLHALARDAWPALVACVEGAPGARGVTAVELRENGRRLSPHTRGMPLDRNAALRGCVERALGAVALPPYVGETPEVSVRFDLAFDMPSLR